MLKRSLLATAVIEAVALASFSHPVSAADAESFRTAEYLATPGALDMIHAAGAYAQGYTGAGVTVGVVDQPVYLDHAEFAGKTGSYWIWSSYSADYDWASYFHGTHVAAILAGQKDGSGMHGVAFDADIISAPNLQIESGAVDALKKLRQTGVKIVNNSWGASSYLDTVAWTAELGQRFSASLDVLFGAPGYLSELEAMLAEDRTLFVFASGNNGHASTELPGSYLCRTEGWRSLLSVVAVNSHAWGEKGTTATNLLMGHTDAAKFAEESSIASPGYLIYSAVSSGTTAYASYSGTSMATPAVSGVAALVSQAFPFLEGDELADVLLSTADSTFELPTFTLNIQVDESEVSDDSRISQVNIYYFGSGTVSDEKVAEDLRQYYEENAEYLEYQFGFTSVDDLLKLQRAVYTDTPREIVFGQGIVNAEAAVKGLAVLNARRLTKSSLSTDYVSTGEALYTVNTKGYSAEWSNDISQRKAGYLNDEEGTDEDLRRIYRFYLASDEKLAEIAKYYGETAVANGAQYIEWYNSRVAENGLAGLNVGLKKTGDGTLTLSGTNTYEGTTVVAGGTLSIAKRADGTGGELTASSVVVESAGRLTGDGTIVNTVTNSGTVSPGVGIGTLTVGGYTQTADGVLEIDFNAAGDHDVLALTGSAGLAGTLNFAPVTDYYRTGSSVTVSDYLTSTSEAAAASEEGTETTGSGFSAVTASFASPTLAMTVTGDDASGWTITAGRAAGAYSRYASDAASAAVGAALESAALEEENALSGLITALDFSSADGSAVRSGLRSLSPVSRTEQVEAAFNRVRLVGALALEENRIGAAPDSWRVSVRPFGGGMNAGWRARHYGLLVSGVTSATENLTVGLHGAAAHERVTGTGTAVSGDTVLAGATLRWAPDAKEGTVVTGEVLVGADDSKTRRVIAAGGWSGTAESSETAFTAAGRLGAGWMLPMGGLTLEPFAAVDLALWRMPDVTESGSDARLTMKSEIFRSARLSAGAVVRGMSQDLGRSAVRGEVRAAVNRELLSRAGRVNASFGALPGTGFTVDADFPEKTSFELAGTLAVADRANGFELGLTGGSELWTRDRYGFFGGLSAVWRW
ncbi:S8 family serine peptidase [Sutterella sp.]|uniref:S8 family serine peptidase n=1 Tax=Sutterella sp. TaxID=1981025 RepID=UPI0026DF06C9|nr:S8 family serine peptidase [Sutterella sp.]MDO5532664.1 S8 family serine peptidase [Sutterella sp.]